MVVKLFANVLARYCLSFLNFILFQSLMKIATLRLRRQLQCQLPGGQGGSKQENAAFFLVLAKSR